MITSAQADVAIEAMLPWVVAFEPWVPVPGSAISGSWSIVDSDDRLYRGSFESAGANTDFIEWPVVLGAGTWTLQVMGTTYLESGIMTCSLDGSTIGTMDWYSAGAVNNVRKYVSDFAVAASGKKSFRIATSTKNASSSGYTVRVQHIAFTRTA